MKMKIKNGGVIEYFKKIKEKKFKKKIFFSIKKIIVKIYLGISLALLQAVFSSVGSVQFLIVPCSSLYLISIGPFQCSRC